MSALQKAARDYERGEKASKRFAPETVEPVDLFGTFEPPPFDCSLLPEQLGTVAEDQGRLIGCDPGIVAMTGLAVLAGAIDDRLQIQPKRHDPTWTESARLWIGIIGDPSTKKTPGMAKALGPIKAAAAKKRDQYRRELKAWEAACEKVKKGDKKPPPPQLQRLTVGDITVEKLSDILGGAGAAPRGVLAVYDELSGHLASMDCYKGGTGNKDKAKWLEAYNGGSVEVDRVNKGSTFVENWSASLCGGIQPSVIHAYASATNFDGMMQRILLYQARPATAGVDQYPDMRAKQAYADLVQELVELAPDDAPVTLSEPAHVIREQYAAVVLKASQNMPNKPLAAMLGKWEGTYARLLLIWHVVECRRLSKYPNTVPVSADNAQKVADLLLRILLPHAITFYAGLDTTEDEARSIAGLILARKWSRFTIKRDLVQNALHFRKLKPWEQDQIIDRLEAYGWIFPEPDKLNERGRPVGYTVNARVHELFEQHAERERERRAEVAAMLNEMKAAKG